MTNEILEDLLYATETAKRCIVAFQQDLDWKRVKPDKQYKDYLKSIEERNLYTMNLLDNAIKELTLQCDMAINEQ